MLRRSWLYCGSENACSAFVFFNPSYFLYLTITWGLWIQRARDWGWMDGFMVTSKDDNDLGADRRSSCVLPYPYPTLTLTLIHPSCCTYRRIIPPLATTTYPLILIKKTPRPQGRGEWLWQVLSRSYFFRVSLR
ncbi:hypothetical protein HD806DRAFT_264799 [Xylariaceae sp. AK1471]|nr:hypothetical protein HD806DRAFT_264799 [Xylariaceae sp. AK1471]